MSNLLSEANAFYFVASSLATLTLLTSLALIVTSIAFLIIVQTGHRKAESTARRKDSNRGMFFLALFFIANQ